MTVVLGWEEEDCGQENLSGKTFFLQFKKMTDKFQSSGLRPPRNDAENYDLYETSGRPRGAAIHGLSPRADNG